MNAATRRKINSARTITQGFGIGEIVSSSESVMKMQTRKLNEFVRGAITMREKEIENNQQEVLESQTEKLGETNLEVVEVENLGGS